MWETVYTHKGFDVQVLSPAMPSEFGYRINDISFSGESYNLISDAVQAIDAFYKRTFS